MNDILKIFISLSFSGSLLILVLLMLKYILKDKVSKQWQYYIWLIVIARLLLPFSFGTNLTNRFIPQNKNIEYQTNLNNTIYTPINPKNIMQKKILYTNQPIQDIITLFTNDIWLVWLVIAIILFIRKITVYQSFIYYIKVERIPISNIELLDYLAIIGKQIGIKRPVELCINPLISSPLLIGFFKPYIVLPSIDIPKQDFMYIILHELTHFRRRDIFYKWLVQITICLHWFNPLVYIMGYEINKACEFSCDEAIISKLEYKNIQEYGKILLDTMETAGKYKESLVTVTLSENKKLLKERLGAIMSYKKKSKYITITTVLLTVIITSGFIATGTYVNNTTNLSKPKKQTTENETVLEKSGISLVDSFGKYGFTYNSKENAVYYNGKRVKQFVDGGAYYSGGGFWCDFYYNDKSNQGTLYLHVVRDSHGSIQDIETMTSDMIQKLYNQDKVLNIKPNQNNLSTEEIYKEFSQYGLTYNKINDTVLYNGEPVKAFVDGGSKYSKGGYWFNITFFNDNTPSSLYLVSARDKNGKIIGIENMSQQMIEDYYGLNGILVPLENEQTVADFNNDVQSIFKSFELPELPSKTIDSGNYYFYENQNSKVLAVTRWKDITGTFNLCDIFNTEINSTVTIGYEITVSKGYCDFIHTNSQITNIIINENVNNNSNVAYDYGVLELNMPNGNNNFSFKCSNADIDIRIVAMY